VFITLYAINHIYKTSNQLVGGAWNSYATFYFLITTFISQIYSSGAPDRTIWSFQDEDQDRSKRKRGVLPSTSTPLFSADTHAVQNRPPDARPTILTALMLRFIMQRRDMCCKEDWAG
jgi:hypothetical protein